MNKKKRISFFILISVLIFFITAGLYKKNRSNIAPPEITAVQNKADAAKKTADENPVKTKKKSGFKSNDEIKKEYGKIETVILWNGRKYTGAVLSTDTVYTIVTIDGIVNIPMTDVKIREIIK